MAPRTRKPIVPVEQETIEAKLTKLIWAAPEGNFAIFATDQGYTVKSKNLGDTPKSMVGSQVQMTGNFGDFKNNFSQQMERQFVFDSYVIQEDPLFFFLTRMIGSISEASAREVVRLYDENIEHIITATPKELLKIKGIGPAILARIVDAWPQYSQYRELSRELLPFGVTPNLVVKIQEHFKEAALNIVMQNPYRLTEIPGIGFKKADGVALKRGISTTDDMRIQSCVVYCVRDKAMQDGDTAITLANLRASMAEEIEDLNGHDQDLVRPAVEKLLSTRELAAISEGDLGEETYLAMAYMLSEERYIMNIAERFSRKRSAHATNNIDAYISQKNAERAARGESPFGEQQREGIKIANTMPPVLGICGFAGTGKTTTSKAILELYASVYGRDNIVCCALAGVAANRTKISSGFDSHTIASLLAKLKDGEKLREKVVLLDEGGMVDSSLMYRLMRAIDFEGGAHLIILGDPAQLNPVGAGDPFADLLHYKLIPHVTLDKIYRNDDDSVITEFAAQVRKGMVPAGYKEKHKDFSFSNFDIPDRHALKNSLSEADYKQVRDNNATEIREHILTLVRRRADALLELFAADELYKYLYDTQVLSPMKEGILGVHALNRHLQDALNPATPNQIQMRIGDGTLRLRDKVLHQENKQMDVERDGGGRYNEKEKVCNGQLGVVVGLAQSTDTMGRSADAETVRVYYPNEQYTVEYTKSQVASGLLGLAYCKTTHKSQGSEYERVIMPIVSSHFMMLNPKLIYTGMTRAKKYLHLAGHASAFHMGCKNVEGTNRNTCISVLRDTAEKKLNHDLPEAAKASATKEEDRPVFELQPT